MLVFNLLPVFPLDGGQFAYDGRGTSALVVLDPTTGDVKQRKAMPYPNAAGALATAGGLIVTALLDGTIVALDDQTLEELWRVDVGTGINAPPMTYSVNGKQYIASGLCCAGAGPGLFRNGRQRLNRIPELRGHGNATMVFVFGL